MTKTRWTRALLCSGLAAALGINAGCGGGEDFANDPRPPVPLQVSGVITDQRVTVSPDSFGAGPIVLIVSNQAEDSHTVTLEGEGIPTERVGPINPLDTATLKKTVPEGKFKLSVDSDEEGVAAAIEPARIDVGSSRASGSDQLLLP
jgi:hypothetical protein